MRRQLFSKLAMTAASALALLPTPGCSNSSNNVLGGVPAIAYISRDPVETGNVFDYTGGGNNGNVWTLTPPTADGQKVNLTKWTGGDVNAMDVSFDAREIVFSGRAPGDDKYHIYRINVDGTNPCDAAQGKVSKGPCQISSGPNDQVYPIYLPAGRIFFVTNANVEGAAVPQFRDEYERATTAQGGSMKLDGSDMILAPRNVSHRVAPTLLADGRILMTEWRHLGDVNEGDLTILDQDLSGAKEAFGRELKGIANSYLHAKEVSPGLVVAIATSRDRTYQAGAIALINLGGKDVASQSEARSSATNLTPLVPLDRTPSFNGVGRFYDATSIGGSTTRFLASWTDGPAETSVLSMAHASPDFGIYVYDSSTQTRYPIVNEVGSWEVSPIALVKRPEPPTLTPAFPAQGTQATLLSCINVYDSSMFPNLTPGTIKKVRVTEGFSSEEGFANMFGLTEFDGQARLGEFDLNADGSFKATIPANVPVRIQLIDKYAMAAAAGPNPGAGAPSTTTEPVWIQGRAAEVRNCPGCHNLRTEPSVIAPGSSLLQAAGAAPLDYPGVPRAQRKSTDYSYDKIMGVPWPATMQQIYNAKCIGCHNGVPGPANPSYTIMDLTDMTTFSMTFDLTDRPVTINAGMMTYTYPASYVSIMGPSMAFEEKNIMVTMGTLKAYVVPGSARDSVEVQMLNPPARFPTLDTNDRAFPNPVHPSEVGTYNGVNGADPSFQLTPDEYYQIILNADGGGQFYYRENMQGAY
jgi:hypothetical protein